MWDDISLYRGESLVHDVSIQHVWKQDGDATGQRGVSRKSYERVVTLRQSRPKLEVGVHLHQFRTKSRGKLLSIVRFVSCQSYLVLRYSYVHIIKTLHATFMTFTVLHITTRV